MKKFRKSTLIFCLTFLLMSCGEASQKSTDNNRIIINTTTTTPLCGNGTIDGDEECEANLAPQETCESKGYIGGNLGCSSDCRWDTSDCETIETCDNGRLDIKEVCEGFEIRGSCESEGFDGGQLKCSAQCSLDTSNCFKCGDGKISGEEICESNDFGGKSCESEGFESGMLSCSDACILDTSACYSCGDGKIDEGESCDSENIGERTCESEGFARGRLGCSNTCEIDTTACTNIGTPCVSDQNCADGMSGFCLTRNSYCSIDCTNDPDKCGADNCLREGGGRSVCLVACSSDAECREDYRCLKESANAPTSCIRVR